MIRTATVAAGPAQPSCHTRPRGFLDTGLSKKKNPPASCAAMGNDWDLVWISTAWMRETFLNARAARSEQ